MRAVFTGSSAERALLCPASQALPWATEEPGDDARRGTAIHAYLATVGELGVDAALELVPSEWREACARIDLRGLPITKGEFSAEVAYAYDVRTSTARELGRNLGRNYGALAPREVPLTVDVVGVGPDSVLVCDYKTGHHEVTRAAHNRQLQLGALAAARCYGRDKATVLVIYVRENAPPYVDRAEFDRFDLDAFAEEFMLGAEAVGRAQLAVLNGKAPDVHMGAHCKHCPVSVAECPGRKALIQLVASSPEAYRSETTAQLTPLTARAAYERYNQIKEALAAVGRALHAYASTNPIPLDDGIIFGPTTSRREYVDGEVVFTVLGRLYGSEVAHLATSRDSTKSAVKEALRSVAKSSGRALAELEREALAAIAAEGGIDERTTTTVKEHKPKRERGSE